MADARLCLDTNSLIDYLKGREPGASAVERAVKAYNCCVTSISVYELLFGVARAQREIGEQVLLGMMTILSLDEAVAKRAANLHAELIRKIKISVLGSVDISQLSSGRLRIERQVTRRAHCKCQQNLRMCSLLQPVLSITCQS